MTLPQSIQAGLLLVLAMSWPCRADDAEWWRMEALRCDYEAHVRLYEIRLARWDAAEADFRAVVRQAETFRALAEETASRKREIEEEIASLQASLTSHKTAWISRRRAEQTGRKLESLGGSGGRIFRDVTISRVTDAGIEFRHATGSARLTARQLTLQQQQDFGIDAVAARETLQAEADQRESYHRAVDRAEAKAEAKTAEREAALAQLAPPLPPVEPPGNDIIPWPGGALDQPARPLGKRSMSRWNSFRTYYFRSGRGDPGGSLLPCPPSRGGTPIYPSLPRAPRAPIHPSPITP